VSIPYISRTYRVRFLAALLISLLVSLLAIFPCTTFVSAYNTSTSILVPPDYLTFRPPAVEGSYTDPVFGTPIKRISDAMNTVSASTGKPVTSISHEYASMSPFNIDNTRLLLTHFGYFALYDGSGNFLKNLWPSPGLTGSSEPRWSKTDPNVLYYIAGNRLMQYNVGTGAQTTLHTFSEYSSISGMGESDISQDGNHFVFAGDKRYVFVYEISTNTKSPALDAGAGKFDSVYITPNNNVLVGYYATGSNRFNGFELYDRNMVFLRQVTHVLGHQDVTTDTTGEEVLIWADGADPHPQISCGGVVKVRLSDGMQTCIWREKTWTNAYHISAPDNSGWFFMDTYNPVDVISLTGWVYQNDEILQVKLDGSEVRRLLHHRSRPLNSYTYQPKASVSHDGTKLVYASNYGLQAQLGYPTEYSDEYLVDLSVASPNTGGSSSGTGSTGGSSSGTGSTGGSSSGTGSTGGSSSGTGSTGGSSSSTGSGGSSPVIGTGGGQNGGVTRIQENGAGVTYTGTWANNSGTFNSGGGAKLSMDPSSRVTLAFNGTGASWIGYSDEWSGIAQVFVDGTLKSEVDTYASPGKAQATIYSVSGLPSGAHTLAIQVTGRKSASSRGAWVWIDAFDVTSGGTGSTTPPPATTPPTAGTSPGSTVTNTAGSSYSITGGATLASTGASSLTVGSAELSGGPSGSAPPGLAIIGYRQNGVLVSEVGVPASAPISGGRFNVEFTKSINTGFAVANPNESEATLSFFFTDIGGTDSGRGSLRVPSHGQIALFLNQAPFNAAGLTNGTFTFSSNIPVGAVAIRGLVNERSEFLMTPLPIANLDRTTNATVFFPHFADGGGWTTHFDLINPTNSPISGTFTFFDQAGSSGSSSRYSIPARSTQRFATQGTDPTTHVGSVRVTPDTSTVAPVGVALFSFKTAGITVSEAGVPSAETGSSYRMYVESTTNVHSGIAIMNSSANATTVKFDLLNLDASPSGLTGSIDIPAGGQRSLFLNEIQGLQSLPTPFKGFVRISSSNGSIAAICLRGHSNERGDFLIATTPPVDEKAAQPTKAVFPQVVDGGGYTTQFVIYGTGNLDVHSQSGSSLNLGLK
jgi:hypothetical protein